jgi:hypothetical protein
MIDQLIYRCGGSDGIAVQRRTVFPFKFRCEPAEFHLSKSWATILQRLIVCNTPPEHAAITSCAHSGVRQSSSLS